MKQSGASSGAGGPPFFKVLRQNLISLRIARALNLTDAARLAGMSRGGLEKIEAGVNAPSLESLSKLSQIYGCSLSSIIQNIEDQTQFSASLPRVRTFDRTKATEEEYQSQFAELALLSGHSQELSIVEDLRKIANLQPELAAKLRDTIHTLSKGLKQCPLQNKTNEDQAVAEVNSSARSLTSH